MRCLWRDRRRKQRPRNPFGMKISHPRCTTDKMLIWLCSMTPPFHQTNLLPSAPFLSRIWRIRQIFGYVCLVYEFVLVMSATRLTRLSPDSDSRRPICRCQSDISPFLGAYFTEHFPNSHHLLFQKIVLFYALWFVYAAIWHVILVDRSVECLCLLSARAGRFRWPMLSFAGRLGTERQGARSDWTQWIDLRGWVRKPRALSLSYTFHPL